MDSQYSSCCHIETINCCTHSFSSWLVWPLPWQPMTESRFHRRYSSVGQLGAIEGCIILSVLPWCAVGIDCNDLNDHLPLPRPIDQPLEFPTVGR